MSENPLKQLDQYGQSVWHDYIRRKEILSGGLKKRIDEDGLLGVTSNPSIFEKAIAGSDDYDESIRQYVAKDSTLRRFLRSWPSRTSRKRRMSSGAFLRKRAGATAM